MRPIVIGRAALTSALLILGSCAAVAQTPTPAVPALAPKSKPKSPGKSCATLTGAMVFFGQDITRADAVKRLDEEIGKHRAKPGNEAAKETSRTVECKPWLPLLNEYECTATATLCK
ncbi:MAG: hypothetical protein NW215_02865 [Hyphomicrobiales bacterium]|nr:hypothetical protein [Hyphomicrobiales bacterium]